jgi:hypothetical protein
MHVANNRCACCAVTSGEEAQRLPHLLCQAPTSSVNIFPICGFNVQSGDKRTDKAQQERLRNDFNLGVADCPVFANIFKYCQVRLSTVARLVLGCLFACASAGT